MAWVKLDENFASHPKVLDAGPLGMALQVAALCYCNRHLTDGKLSRTAARTLLDFEGLGFVGAIRGEDATADRVIDDLIYAGLWHGPGHDCPDCEQIDRGYVIHDYLDQQPSKASVEEQKRQAAENGRKGGLAKAKRTAKRNASEPPSDDSSESLAKVCPDTDTDTDTPLSPSDDGKKRKRQIPDSWHPNEKHYADNPNIDVDAQAESFRDHAIANSRTLADWDAGFRNWLRKAHEIAGTSPRPPTRDPEPVQPSHIERNLRRARGEACVICNDTGYFEGTDNVAHVCNHSEAS